MLVKNSTVPAPAKRTVAPSTATSTTIQRFLGARVGPAGDDTVAGADGGGVPAGGVDAAGGGGGADAGGGGGGAASVDGGGGSVFEELHTISAGGVMGGSGSSVAPGSSGGPGSLTVLGLLHEAFAFHAHAGDPAGGDQPAGGR